MANTTSTLPRWTRALLALDRLVARGHRAHEVLRNELLRTFVGPEARALVTDLAYARELGRYAPGGSVFSWGLLPWEERALAHMALRPGDRILLGGAGGGRELQALLARGYTVDAFEPQARLRAAAQAMAGKRGKVHRGGYSDLPAALERRGPLADLSGPYAAVVCGWASFSHVTDPDLQRAALTAVRGLAPRGRVLVSFFAQGAVGPGTARCRRWLQALSGQRPDEHLGYLPHCGFYYSFSASRLAELTTQSGYQVDYYETHPYPHAVLQARASVPPARP